MKRSAKQNTMTMIRTFVALPLIGPESVENWINELKMLKIPGKIKWSNKDGLWHLTLKFIGNVDEENLKLVQDALRDHITGLSPGEVVLEGAGVFGNREHPKVIWAGIRKSKWLLDMKQRVEESVSVLDLPVDNRIFRPHLTIGRIKYLKNTELLLKQIDQKEHTIWGKQPVSRVVLFRSQLTPEGPVYSEIESFWLEEK